MKNFSKDLRKHSANVINCHKLEMVALTNKEKKSYSKQIFGDNDDKKYCKVWDHCYYIGKDRGASHSIFNLRYKKFQ